jgi:prepilin-type processing-associated H-X9-DG protein
MVKSAAQASNCSSNLRQLGLANMCYANDWEGFVIAQRILPADSANPTMWDINAYAYLDGAGKVFSCPSDRLGLNASTTIAGTVYTWKRSFSIICTAAAMDPGWAKSMSFDGGSKPLSQVDASGTAWLSECPGPAHSPGAVWASTRRRVSEVAAPHSAKGNWLFADGHIGRHAPPESIGNAAPGYSTSYPTAVGGNDFGVTYARGFWTATGGD